MMSLIFKVGILVRIILQFFAGQASVVETEYVNSTKLIVLFHTIIASQIAIYTYLKSTRESYAFKNSSIGL